ncbi:hypothetical protein Y032_0148g2653 [Ancylostoma ceylanicum]|uniref:Uncharacterized protein n=1 Tax=Ancylostoma ceylanicum TaxID=53326 RepID=A0A016T1Q0_9BILA|nr:hypothetical protein Y032_0148g2653 [Ancylostoma ceylanicum]
MKDENIQDAPTVFGKLLSLAEKRMKTFATKVSCYYGNNSFANIIAISKFEESSPGSARDFRKRWGEIYSDARYSLSSSK